MQPSSPNITTEILEAVLSADQELITLLRWELPFIGGLILMTCIMFLVAIGRFKTQIDAHTEVMRKMLKRHNRRIEEAIEDSAANEVTEITSVRQPSSNLPDE